MSYIYGYVGGSGVISGGMTGGAEMSKDFIDKDLVDKIEAMAKAEAYGCSYEDIPIQETDGGMICKRVYKPVRPLPCVRDEHGAIKEQTVKALIAKIDEELTELKQAVFIRRYFKNMEERIAEEAADTITAITTMLEALGIDAEMRDEAQRRVNEKNRKRNRL